MTLLQTLNKNLFLIRKKFLDGNFFGCKLKLACIDDETILTIQVFN